MDKSTLVCEDCGKTNIQVKAWIDANTNRYISDAGDGDSGDNWCDDCQDHTTFMSKGDYDEMNED